MREWLGTLWIATVFLVSGFSGMAELHTSDQLDHTVRAPIVILGDENFTAANGVTGGNGSSLDPFLIEGWEIKAENATGITVLETTVHFTIRDVYVHTAEILHSGIYFENVRNGSVEDSNVSCNWRGIQVVGSEDILISGNQIFSNGEGIISQGSSNVTMKGNVVSDSKQAGISISSSLDIHADGNNIYSNHNEGIFTNNSTRISFSGNAVLNNLHGSHFLQSKVVSLSMDQYLDNRVHGIYLDSSSHIVIDRVYAFRNGDDGIYDFNSSFVDITRSTTRHNGFGLYFDGANSIDINESSLWDNVYGAYAGMSRNITFDGSRILDNWQTGLITWNCTEISVTRSHVFSNNVNGVHLKESFDSIVSESIISDNVRGIVLEDSANIKLYHNELKGNTEQSRDNNGNENSWDNGYPSGGNHWSDYAGIDNCSGTNQSVCPDPDGVGDTPYRIDDDSWDRYPLMNRTGETPSAPGNPTAHAGFKHVNVSWLPPDSEGGFPILEYRVYKGTLPSQETYLTDVRWALCFNDTDVEDNTTYYYKVSAVNAVGEGGLSNETSATPFGLPTKPQNLEAVGDDQKIMLSWMAPVSDGGLPIINYRIYRGNSSGQESFLAEIGTNMSYSDTSTINGRRYYYRISALNAFGEGPLTATVSAVSASTPKPPTKLWAKIGGLNFENFTVTWNTSGDDNAGQNTVLGYRIMRGTVYNASGSGYSHIATLPRLATVFVDSYVGEGDPDNYFYQVCSFDTNNKTNCSEEQVAKFTRSLGTGRNLVSIPLAPFDERAEIVLQTLAYDQIWLFDAWSRSWKSYYTSKPFDSWPDLNHTSGFWVEVTKQSNLTFAGLVPRHCVVNLRSGWNLIGFPHFVDNFTVADFKSEVSVISVEGLDASSSPYSLRTLQDSELLCVGHGYWVWVDADGSWIVSN